MKIINPSVELLAITETPSLLIEKAARVCYKSEDMTGPGSDVRLIKSCMNKHHMSIIEHGSASFRIVCDRGISHEIVRHRIASYSQECLSGDTFVSKNLTIRDLFKKKKNVGVKLKSAAFDRVIPNWTSKVFFKGYAPVFEMTTERGYRIKATGAHEFMRSDGTFSRLEMLSVGDDVIVNGRQSLLKIDDELLKDEYVVQHLDPHEISLKYSAPYRSVIRRLKFLGVFEKHLNDKNKEKYQKNHGPEVISKMRNTINRGFVDGRKPWNFGVSEEENESVFSQAEALRTNHWNNQSGPLNSAWKGGPKKHVEARLIKTNINSCEVCGHGLNLEVHHVDKNVTNNSETNLLKLCENCHEMQHHGWWVGVRTHIDKISSIEYVGIEDVYDIEMTGPFHNYVANGFVVHNSTRYCNYGKDKFGNEISVVQPPGLSDVALDAWTTAMEAAEKAYFALIEAGQPPQIARSVLPTCLKTELIMTANFREWRHFIDLREAKNAHPQIRPIASAIRELLTEKVPVIFGDMVASTF